MYHQTWSDVEIGEIYDQTIVWGFVIPQATLRWNKNEMTTWSNGELMYTWKGRDKNIFLPNAQSVSENEGSFCMRILDANAVHVLRDIR